MLDRSGNKRTKRVVARCIFHTVSMSCSDHTISQTTQNLRLEQRIYYTGKKSSADDI